VVLLLELLSLFIKRIDDSVKVLENVKGVLEHLNRLSLLKDDETVSPLV
jgi:lipid-A-disaccharide synthase-like uncharacterized protein